jgi:hypothetical protein
MLELHEISPVEMVVSGRISAIHASALNRRQALDRLPEHINRSDN